MTIPSLFLPNLKFVIHTCIFFYQANNTLGASFVFHDTEHKFHLPDCISEYTAGAFCLMKATGMINNWHTNPDNYVIHTNSLSSIQSIQQLQSNFNSTSNTNNTIIQEILENIHEATQKGRKWRSWGFHRIVQ